MLSLLNRKEGNRHEGRDAAFYFVKVFSAALSAVETFLIGDHHSYVTFLDF